MLPLLLALAPAAPVPKPPPPNPLGYAYVGVRITVADSRGGGMTIDPPDPGTPAAKAGLLGGDVLVGVGGRTVANFDEFADHVIDLRPGTAVVVEVRRAGKPLRVWVTLGERPDDYGEPDFSRKTKYPRNK